MLKKILVSQLRPGMYVQELCGDWMSHPFWRGRFRPSADDIQRLSRTSVREVYIDTSRGIDVEGPAPALAETPPVEVLVQATQTEEKRHEPTTLAEEMHTAERVHAQASKVVQSIMKDARMGRALNVGAAEQAVEAITDSVLRNDNALLGLIGLRGKDEYTFAHSVSVCTLLVAFAQSRGMPREMVRELGVAGLLHDVGKIVIPDEVLNKPGKLTEAEFAIVKQHPEAGWNLLRTLTKVGEIPLDVTRHHHERLDGTGYPDKLPDEKISVAARMAAIVDVYDAITADRCYHRGMVSTDALRKMWEWSDGHFDRLLLQEFMRCVGIYPTGTLVKLASNKLGVVVEQHATSLLTPKVRVFFSVQSNCRFPPRLIDLAKGPAADKIVSSEAPRDWGFGHDVIEDMLKSTAV